MLITNTDKALIKNITFYSFLAIANYTERHILSISLSGVKTEKSFYNVFNKEYINGKKIPHNKRLYVLEDIDYLKRHSAEYDPYACSRGRETDQKDKSDTGNNKEASNKSSNKWLSLTKNVHFKKKSLQTTENTTNGMLTFSKLIDMIDNIMERNGVMMIINTRYPQRLEAIFVQPGVVNVKLL